MKSTSKCLCLLKSNSTKCATIDKIWCEKQIFELRTKQRTYQNIYKQRKYGLKIQQPEKAKLNLNN